MRERRLNLAGGLLALACFSLTLSSGSAAIAATLSAPGAAELSPGLAALADPALQPEGTGLPELAEEGPEPVLLQGERALVYVRFEGGARAGVAALREAGAQIVAFSPRYQTVTVAAKAGQLEDVAAVSRVASVAPVHPPIVAGVEGEGASAASATPCFGAATSEGDVQLSAMAAREGFEVDGSGVKVGVLSDSYNRDVSAGSRALEDIASGDLPGAGNPCGFTTPVEVIDEGPSSGEDEGRAMAQIVHDLAPGAAIAFASAFKGEFSFAENIGKLAEKGARVIVDDVFYPDEPFFQEGPIAVAVDEAVKGGVTYLSAAGNDNLIDSSGNDIGSWEAPAYRDAGSCPAPVVHLSEEAEKTSGPAAGLNPHHCMNFRSGSGTDEGFGITVGKGETLAVDLQWAEPRNEVLTDLDAFLLNAGGEVVELSTNDNASRSGTQEPVELLEWENDTGAAAVVRLVINRYSGSEDPRLKFALLENGGGVSATEYPQSSGGDVVGPTIFGHSGSASAVSVAAAPFFSDEEPEEYSSRGPVTHYFGPVEGTTPAEPLASPEVVPKPDLTATDGGANTFFGSCVSHTWRFFGTSAAAPHAGAVAALALQAAPAATPQQLREALTETASPVGAFAPSAVGSGLVNAPEAIASITGTPFPGGTQSTQPAPQNCGLPKTSGPGQVVPPPSPAPQPQAAPEPKPAPQTVLLQHPPKVVLTSYRSALAVFRFGSNQEDVSYSCRIDGRPFRRCAARLARYFPLGSHKVTVAARNAEGLADRSPVSYRFKVRTTR
ncbi:MAG TPA: S8 family serine peptidase [Solirubrobacterales bacterium]|nr:S8 family serine peptidase [Solirubrobacterales bacterium]